MKVTFPHLGPLHLVVTQLLSYLGIPFISPPLNGHSALSKGASISPEEICLPFKYMAGNLALAHDIGADTAVMMATSGPCRLGEYGELLKAVLDDVGYCYRWILVDDLASIGIKETFRRLKQINAESSAGTIRTVIGTIMAVRLLHKVDKFRNKAEEKAGYLEESFEAVKLLHETEEELQKADSFKKCFSILKHSKRKLAGFTTKENADPVRILIAGEIYTSIETDANGRLEEKLMAMGCCVRRHIDISWWIRHTILEAVIPDKLTNLFRRGYPIGNNVGGYGRETVAKIVKDRWSDGIIKIMPAGCMPEIVTKAFCESIQDSSDVRILNLIYDEMSGQAGYDTRIEAFVDMLERRKDVLAGSRHRFHKYRSGFDG